jgi:protein TonB
MGTAILHSPLFEATTSPPVERRPAPPSLGLLLSILLHGTVLASVAGWSWSRSDAPPAVEVTLLVEAAPQTTEPAAQTETAPHPKPAPATAHPVEPNPTPPPPSRVARHHPSPQPTPATPPSLTPDAPNPVSTTASDPAGESNGTSSDGTVVPAGTGGKSAGMGSAADGPAAPAAGNPAPAYPLAARRSGREGRTVLRVVVAADGQCTDVEIAETSGTPSLDEAAMTAVRHWRFSPAIKAGRTAESAIMVPISFKLTNVL